MLARCMVTKTPAEGGQIYRSDYLCTPYKMHGAKVPGRPIPLGAPVEGKRGC